MVQTAATPDRIERSSGLAGGGEYGDRRANRWHSLRPTELLNMRRTSQLNLAVAIVASSALAGVLAYWLAWHNQRDEYLPSVPCADGAYVFSDQQKARMAKTPLDRELFVRYVESEWPIEKLYAFCTPERANLDLQGLVPHELLFGTWEIPIYRGINHGFDKLYVYASGDDGNNGFSRYFGEAATEWRRWGYAVIIRKDDKEWETDGCLPNDFMDRPNRYLPR